jgi:RHS repeat-associated protein
MRARLRRCALLLFVGLTLFPSAAFPDGFGAPTAYGASTQLQPIALPPFELQVVSSWNAQDSCSSQGGTDPLTGVSTFNGMPMTIVNGSPAMVGAPRYNSQSAVKTEWGMGWTSDVDQFLTIVSSQNITWTQAGGGRLTYFNVATATSSAPSFVTPPNIYQTMTVLTSSNAVPTSIAERDKDGTKRTFSLYSSTSMFRLSQLKDRNGNTVTYTRNTNGQLTQATDVHGRYLQLTYSSGLITKLADSGGRSVSYAYDSQGRKVSENGPQGIITYSYNALNQLAQILYPNGSIHEYTYDSSNRVLTEDDGNGVNKKSYTYSATGTTVTDALGHQTVYTSTSSQGLMLPSQTVDADGGVTTFAYDGNMNLTKTVDQLGRATQYSYDKMGNVTATVDAAGGQAHANYELTFNQPLESGDPLGHITSFVYDGTGDLIKITDPLNHAALMSYDSLGHMTQSTDPLNLATNNTYSSSNGALATTEDPLSHTTTLTTDALSRVTQNKDALNNTTQYTYDTANDLTQMTDALSHSTNYSYIIGRSKKLLSQLTDANSHSTNFSYDAQARLTSVTDALSHTKTSSYDAASNLIKTVNARGQTITYTHDNLNRLISKTMPEGAINYTYDAAGNMLTASSYNGSKLQMTYDSINRVTQVIQTLPSGFQATIGYSYDANGNRTGMTTPWGSFSYGYDALNRLTSVTNPQSNTFTFIYDADGRRTQMVAPNGVTTVYTYDNASRITSITATNSSSVVVSSESYTYDAVGNRLTMTDVEGTHNYTYDSIYRLTQAQHPADTSLPISTETFSYDAVSNRLADAQITGYTYNAGNELTSNSSFTYTYDADGNLATKTDTSSNETTFSFDSRNELTGLGLPGGTNWAYQYDARGDRIEKSSGTAAGQTIYYVYAGLKLLAVLDESNNPIVTFTNGPNLSEPLLLHEQSGDYYADADGLQSIKVLTNTSGAVSETYDYSAYGQPIIRDGSGNILNSSQENNPMTYAGMIWDLETQLFLDGGRFYDPAIGRFLRRDRSTFIPSYRYARNNPINNIDWDGLRALNQQEVAFVQQTIQALNNADAAHGTEEFSDAANGLQRALQNGAISTGWSLTLPAVGYCVNRAFGGNASGATLMNSGIYMNSNSLSAADTINPSAEDIANDEALLAHEAVHYNNGPNESAAYQVQYDFLNALGQTNLANQLYQAHPTLITK